MATPRTRSVIEWLTFSIAAGWLVVAVELLVVGVLSRERIASVWEVQFASFWLSPVALAAAAAISCGAALVWWTAERARQAWARRSLMLVVGVGAACAAWGVGGGRHLADLGPRLGFAASVGGAAMAVAYAAGPRLAGTIAEAPRRLALLTVLTVVALEVVNRFVLVRLYPAFHISLGVCALLAAPGLTAAAWSVGNPRKGWRRSRGPAIVLAVVAASVAVAKPASARLAHFDNFRLLLLGEAPLLGHVVDIAARLAPPPPIDEADIECGGARCEPSVGSGQPLPFRSRDILLVTIDALRADHVGAYGYERPVTPNIDALAASGIVFERAYCPTPHTSYSVTSMMTGKYMRPLLLQQAGQDSDTWATLLRQYGYRTAAFYPPAIFFIDESRFRAFAETGLGFEHRKEEFLEGEGRVSQVERYLDTVASDQRVFVWVHLFGPHEPYEAHAGFDFGNRDIDRYDAEIAAADRTVGRLVEVFRKRRPSASVIVTADHGEEFGEHGGRYHGTTVYEEQVRVPLVIDLAGNEPARVAVPVQTLDLLPTVLAGMDIPRPARIRGRDLGPLVASSNPGPGFALAETEDYALLAEEHFRLICARKIGACQLFDLAQDPTQKSDVAALESGRFEKMRARLRSLGASHGRFEKRGLRAEGKGWPAPILRGVAGDGDAAEEIATLLDDADVAIRRKAAELLFELERPAVAPALRLALQRDEDENVKKWCALALTRLGQGAPLAYELAKSPDLEWRRLAALALGESGDSRGVPTLVAWWKDEAARDYSRSLDILEAFSATRPKDAVWPLVQSLGDVRLRPHIAKTLAAIGEDVARVPLIRALKKERFMSARIALTDALVQLGAEADLAEPLVWMLGVADPLPGGLGYALEADILERIGGPTRRQLRRIRADSAVGVAVTLIVPRGGNGRGVRVLVRARLSSGTTGEIRIGRKLNLVKYNSKGEPRKVRDVPRIDPDAMARLQIRSGEGTWVDVHQTLEDTMRARPGRPVEVVVFADRNVEVGGLALVPLADELAPPEPQPWTPDAGTARAAGEGPDAGSGN